jgi:hypothetical protein
MWSSNVFAWSLAFVTGSLMLASSPALAQSHATINQNRSSLAKNVFVSQAIEGEYGQLEKHLNPAGEGPMRQSQSWQGYGIRNGVGIELFKFTQFSLAHTLLDLRSRDTSLENMSGSRLALGLDFAFSSPIGNVEFGGGATASQLSYQNVDQTATFIGTGHYYAIGINYFLSPSISFFATGRRYGTKYKQSTGQNQINSMTADRDSLGLGVKIWL